MNYNNHSEIGVKSISFDFVVFRNRRIYWDFHITNMISNDKLCNNKIQKSHNKKGIILHLYLKKSNRMYVHRGSKFS